MRTIKTATYTHTRVQLFSTTLSFTSVNARKTHILKCIISKLKEVLDESLLQVPSFAILLRFLSLELLG